MMKRTLSLVLTLLLLFHCGVCFAGYDEGNGGDGFVLQGSTTGTVLENAYALDPRTGPGSLYDPVDPADVNLRSGSTIDILTRVYVGGVLWVLAEVPTYSMGYIRCYLIARSNTQKIRFDEYAVPEEAGPDNLVSIWACRSYEDEALFFGPGEYYAYSGGYLRPNDNAWVILMDGYWALVEVSNRFDGAGTVYAWRGWVLFGSLVY